MESGWRRTVAVGGGGGVAGVAVAGLGDGDGDGGGSSAGLAALQEGRVAQGPLEPDAPEQTHVNTSTSEGPASCHGVAAGPHM